MRHHLGRDNRQSHFLMGIWVGVVNQSVGNCAPIGMNEEQLPNGLPSWIFPIVEWQEEELAAVSLHHLVPPFYPDQLLDGLKAVYAPTLPHQIVGDEEFTSGQVWIIRPNLL